MRNFDQQLKDQKLNTEFLLTLFRALLEHLDLKYEIRGNTKEYKIKIKKRLPLKNG